MKLYYIDEIEFYLGLIQLKNFFSFIYFFCFIQTLWYILNLKIFYFVYFFLVLNSSILEDLFINNKDPVEKKNVKCLK